jgi:hypothetical protein
MNHSPLAIRHSSRERGVALILTLAILALVTLLLIAFVTSMRVENMASKNFNELIKARQLARAGVDGAVGAIRNAAPPVSTVTNYVTAPGIIYTWSPNIPTPNHWMTNALFTSDGANNVDLNANLFITGQGTLYTAGSPNSQLRVGWSNMTATVNGINQLVGRYAYWVDDESAKVNVNYAGARGNDLEGYAPAAIDLQPFFGFFGQVAITNYLYQYLPQGRQYDTIESLRMQAPQVQFAPGISDAAYSNNQFYVTANSASPNLTAWGTQRVDLNNLVVGSPTPALKQAAVVTLAAALNNGTLSTWFGGQTFANKYNLQPTEIQQIAANIIDYLTTDNIPTDLGTFNDTTAPNYLGLKETPYLNKLVISNTFVVAENPAGSGIYQLTINSYPLVELWYMYGNSGGWTVPNKPSVVLLSTSANPLSFSIGAGMTPNSASISTSYSIKNGFNSMGPNSYLVLSGSTPMLTTSASANFGGSPPATVPVTLNAGTITAIFTSQPLGTTAGRMDYAVVGFPTVIHINVPVGTPVSARWSAQCNDPRVKPVSNTWKQSLAALAFGVQNTAPTFNQSAGSGTILGDGDSSCHTNAANLPNNSGVGRQRGSMTLGELAFIHTGVPWRTLSLQSWPPTANPSEPGPPDWALLDLFSSTNLAVVNGLMNINQFVTNALPLPTLLRGQFSGALAGPLAALLTNNLTGVGANYGSVNAAYNIYYYGNRTMGANARFTPISTTFPNFSPYSYTMVGEIANTQSLSNFGPAGTPKSVLETPVRDIVNIITTRSDTFTIWCLAQSIRKVDKTDLTHYRPDLGDPPPTGEAKVQAIVQRMVDNSSGTPQVKFRTLYYRYLYQ